MHINQTKQYTLRNEIAIEGVGLHTGQQTKIILKPAAEDFGYQFCRIDKKPNLFINADCDLVTDTSRGTTLTYQNVSVATIEHLLAALVACGIDNCLIETNGMEIPILDGSSYPFVVAIENAGILEQSKPKVWHEITTPLFFKDEHKDVDMILVPAKEYQLCCTIDFDSEVLGVQTVFLKHLTHFKEHISHSRTFCFLHELELLLQHHLIKGGDLNNAIVVVNKPLEEKEIERLAKIFNKPAINVKKGYLNNLELRYDNEPARHKLLDIIGDLALSGKNIKGKVIAIRPGHKTNVEFAKKIKNYFKN